MVSAVTATEIREEKQESRSGDDPAPKGGVPGAGRCRPGVPHQGPWSISRGAGQRILRLLEDGHTPGTEAPRAGGWSRRRVYDIRLRVRGMSVKWATVTPIPSSPLRQIQECQGETPKRPWRPPRLLNGRTGGKVMGYFCTLVPEEILRAAVSPPCVPFSIRPGGRPRPPSTPTATQPATPTLP